MGEITIRKAQVEFSAEIMLHFNGLKDLNKSPFFVYR